MGVTSCQIYKGHGVSISFWGEGGRGDIKNHVVYTNSAVPSLSLPTMPLYPLST